MSLTERFKYFNRINFNNFLKFKINNLVIGYIHKNIAYHLATYFKNNFLLIQNDFILNKIDNNIFSFNNLTDFFKDITTYLLKKGFIGKITNEYCAVTPLDADETIFKLERALLSKFAIKSKGVHLNGYALKGDEIHIWVAKRSKNKLTFPCKLDNIVAGGVSYGYSFFDTLIKESYEEATINKELIQQANLCSKIHYLYPYKKGIRNDIIYIYNLELPLKFIPSKNDGEVDGFALMKCDEVLNILKNTNDFKFNCAIAFIIFLLEKNLINKENTKQKTINNIKNKISNMLIS